MVVGFCGGLLFLFVPETFWDRAPEPRSRKGTGNFSKISLFSHKKQPHEDTKQLAAQVDGSLEETKIDRMNSSKTGRGALPNRPILARRGTPSRSLHVGFVPSDLEDDEAQDEEVLSDGSPVDPASPLSSTVEPLGPPSTG